MSLESYSEVFLENEVKVMKIVSSIISTTHSIKFKIFPLKMNASWFQLLK